MKYIRLILIILALPAMIAYEFTFALILMPLIYGKRKYGIILFVPLWLLTWSLSPLGFIPYFNKILSKFNNYANWSVGYPVANTVSSQLGNRIDLGIASWVEIVHCRILGTLDSRGYHCSKKARKLF